MSGSSYKMIGFVFDVIAAIVSLLDLTTDLIILITWYQQERMIFFYISLSILILAQLSYVSIFYYNHGTWDDLCRSFLSVLCTLPFAPVLSFVFYFVSNNDSILRKFIDKFLICFNFDWNENYVDPQASPQQQYLDDKIYKHLGFLLEAMIEAFPQSILQLAAIVYYNEPNLISVISILISMSSVCSKILLLVITGNLVTWKMKLFVWLSFVVDFFGIFYIISYCFYRPTDDTLQIYFIHIRNICIWEIIICIFPFAIIGSIGLHLYWTVKLTIDVVDSYIYRCIFAPLIAIAITFLWVIGLFVTLLSMTIFCVWWAAVAVIGMAISGRLPWDKISKKFYSDFIDWIMNDTENIIDINDNNKILINKNRNRILKICIFNKFVLENHKRYIKPKEATLIYDEGWMNYFDKDFINYLQQQSETQFRNVNYTDLRMNCDITEYKYQHHIWQNRRKHPYFMHTFYYEVYATLLTEFKYKFNQSQTCYNYIAVLTLYYLTWIAGPIYILSRFFNVILPLVVGLYLYINGNGINLFTDIHIFQVIMCCSYVMLLFIWFILGIFVLKNQFYLWHILPSTGYLKGSKKIIESNKVERMIKDCYFEMTLYPIIEQILNDTFGADISNVVLHYFNNIKIDMANQTVTNQTPMLQRELI